jgi:hypothetical protein
MRWRQIRILLLLASIALAVSVGTASANEKAKSTVLVVVSSESKVTNISLSKLRKLFGGDNRSSLIPLNRPNGTTARVIFDSVVLGLSPEQVGRYWIDRKIRGEKGSPRKIRSRKIVLGILARHPEAIGYVRAGDLPAGVRAVLVGGFSNESPSYPLRGTSK